MEAGDNLTNPSLSCVTFDLHRLCDWEHRWEAFLAAQEAAQERADSEFTVSRPRVGVWQSG